MNNDALNSIKPWLLSHIMSSDYADAVANTLELIRRGDTTQARQTLRRLERVHPANWHIWQGFSLASLKEGKLNLARQEAETAKKLGMTSWNFSMIMSRIELEDFKFKNAIPHFENMLSERPENTNILGKYALCTLQIGDTEKSIDLLASYLKLGGKGKVVSRFLDQLSKKLAPAAYQRHVRALTEHSTDAWQLLMAVRQYSDAATVARSHPERCVAEQLSALKSSQRQFSEAAFQKRGQSVYSETRPNGTVLVFGGLTGGYFLPMAALDDFFAELGITSVFLRDSHRKIYLDGADGFGDNLTETISSLKQIFATSVSKKPIFTFGASSGGLAAIYYATKLDAKASILFSPTTTFDEAEHTMFDDRRARAMARRLNRTLQIEDYKLDKIFAQSTPDYSVTAFAAKQNPIDLGHANLLRSYPQVSVKTLDEEDAHNSLIQLATRYNLLDLLRTSFQLDT